MVRKTKGLEGGSFAGTWRGWPGTWPILAEYVTTGGCSESLSESLAHSCKGIGNGSISDARA